MKRSIFPAIGGLLLAAAFPQWAVSQDESNSGQQNSAATSKPQPEGNANDNQSRLSEQNRDQNQNRDDQNRSDQTRNDQNRGDQNNSDEDEIEYRGMEHAALGVLLSERNGNNPGVRIRETLPQSPANRAGLRAGDQITEIDGKRMKTYGDVIRFINRVQPGQQAAFVVRRDNQDRTIKVTFATREEVWGNDHDEFHGDQNQQYSRYDHREFGNRQQFSGNENRTYSGDWSRQGRNQFRDPNLDDRMARSPNQSQRRWSYQDQHQDDGQREYGQQATLGVGLESERGVPIVRSVVPGSPADEAGLQPGDEIVAINNQQVRNHSELLNALARYQAGEQVNVLVQQDGRNHTMRIRLASGMASRQHNGRDDDHYERQGYRTGSTRLEGVQPDGFRRDGFRADRKIEEER